MDHQQRNDKKTMNTFYPAIDRALSILRSRLGPQIEESRSSKTIEQKERYIDERDCRNNGRGSSKLKVLSKIITEKELQLTRRCCKHRCAKIPSGVISSIEKKYCDFLRKKYFEQMVAHQWFSQKRKERLIKLISVPPSDCIRFGLPAVAQQHCIEKFGKEILAKKFRNLQLMNCAIRRWLQFVRSIM
jgi:hypothetical protein